ncbi:YciI family protein [Myxococcus sp. K38C18041901]|uniref:YciI family protein n=1 Tax=Myxococcus guangdongensis TaxID=2906760 RepID=UPI0020A6E764|nr:YciI family protein [Myxococcus guangdongensis]MCP3057926.1 YciI family protein [Myxococcus guangdongensis]
MRFILLLKASLETESGGSASRALVTAMDRYNDELVRAGVLLDAAGLHPTSRGARIDFSQGKRTVTTGPFSAPDTLIAGFWMIQVKTHEEALEWARRCPHLPGSADAQIELRQVLEPTELEELAREPVAQEARPRAAGSRS